MLFKVLGYWNAGPIELEQTGSGFQRNEGTDVANEGVLDGQNFCPVILILEILHES